MLVDPEHHQDEFRRDAGAQNAEQHAGKARDRRECARDRIEHHGAERGHQSRQAAQDHDHHDKPVE